MRPPDPEEYIDCGTVSYDDQSFPAARAEHRFKYTPAGARDRQFQQFADAKALGSKTGWAIISALAASHSIEFTQTVELEAIVLFQLKPYDSDIEKTKIFAYLTYFVTRSLWGVSSSGESSPTDTETISFSTNKTAAFKDSTRCRGNYHLEKDMLTFISTVAELP